MVTSITHSSLESRDQRNKQLNRGGDLFERQIGMQKGFFFLYKLRQDWVTNIFRVFDKFRKF